MINYFFAVLWKTGIDVSILRIKVISTKKGSQAVNGKKSIIFYLLAKSTLLSLPSIPIEPQVPTKI